MNSKCYLKYSHFLSIAFICCTLNIIKGEHQSEPNIGLDMINAKIMRTLDANRDGKLSKKELGGLNQMIFDELNKAMKKHVRSHFAKDDRMKHIDMDKITENLLRHHRPVIDEVVDESIEEYHATGVLPKDIVHRVDRRMKAKMEQQSSSGAHSPKERTSNKANKKPSDKPSKKYSKQQNKKQKPEL